MRPLGADQIDAVRAARVAGHSFAVTARLLGLTKGKVAGIVRRHLKKQSTAQPEGCMPRRRYKPRAKRQPLPRPNYGACCYPLSAGKPWRFCGKRVEQLGAVYCTHHRRRCYQRRVAR
jgi:hypothetical protein